MGFNEDSTTERLEIRQAKLQAREEYASELVEAEDERFSSVVNDELESIVSDLSYYSDFADKLDGINGELSSIDHEYALDGGFNSELTLEELDELKARVDRVVNDTHGTNNQFKGVARALEKAVESVTLGYETQLL